MPYIPRFRGPQAVGPTFFAVFRRQVAALAYSSEVLADAPAGYWRLGEPSGTLAADSSGHALDGTYVGSPTLAQPGGVVGDTAATFSGAASQRVDVSHSALLALTGDLTLEAWVKPVDAGGFYFIVAKDNGFLPGPYEFRLQSGTGIPVLLVTTDNAVLAGTTAPATGVWSHVAVTITAAGAWTHYLNGSLNGSGSTAQARYADAGLGLKIGSRDDLFNGFNGGLDEVAVYPTVLSAARIQAHYDARNNPSAVTSGPASFVVTASDSITFAESVTRQVTCARATTDSITFSETLTRTRSGARAVADSITFAESVTGVNGKTRAVVDSVTLADALTRTAQGFPRTSTDSLTFSDTPARTLANPRAITGSLTFSESTLSSQGKTRIAADTVSFSESFIRTSLGFARTASNSLTFAEASTRIRSSARLVTDSITFSESVAASKGISRFVTDTLSFSETLTRGVAGHPRTPVDTVTFSESVARTQSLTARASTDTITFAEVLTRGGTTPATVLSIALHDQPRINLYVTNSGRVSAIANDTLKPAALLTDTPRTQLVITHTPRVALAITDKPAQ